MNTCIVKGNAYRYDSLGDTDSMGRVLVVDQNYNSSRLTMISIRDGHDVPTNELDEYPFVGDVVRNGTITGIITEVKSNGDCLATKVGTISNYDLVKKWTYVYRRNWITLPLAIAKWTGQYLPSYSGTSAYEIETVTDRGFAVILNDHSYPVEVFMDVDQLEKRYYNTRCYSKQGSQSMQERNRQMRPWPGEDAKSYWVRKDRSDDTADALVLAMVNVKQLQPVSTDEDIGLNLAVLSYNCFNFNQDD